MRKGVRERATRETRIRVEVALDERGETNIDTGIAMLDHLFEQWAFYARVRLELTAQSLDRIEHHLAEDAAIVLGAAVGDALGDRCGIERSASVVQVMDESLVRCALDLSGRPYVRVDLGALPERIEDLSSSLVSHVIRSFGEHVRAGVHVDRLRGDDPHHVVEAAFKALGRACRSAWSYDESILEIPSTKGMLV